MNKNHYVIIMAGGVGSRFWPVSRTSLPKQFIDVLGTGKTLIQNTYDRFKQIVPEENIYVLTNHKYVTLVQEQLGITDMTRIIGEPAMRNTAPCIAYACHKLHALNQQATMVIAPSDHLIQDTHQFLEDVKQSLEAAENNKALITLGIKPSRPDTGYGYIQADSLTLPNFNAFHKVSAFKEKPDAKTAQQYVESGEYLWNAGIFVWNVQTILGELEKYEEQLNAIFLYGKDKYNTAEEEEFLQQYYPTCNNISIDYAIMEKSNLVYVLPVDFGWSDLGTWTSVYGLSPQDGEGNVLIPDANNVILYNSSNCMVNVPSYKKVVLKNLHNYIVVEANDTLLICPIDTEQEVKQVVADAAKQFGENYI
ncbi:mannose-1-phosphate guanylyltransferase [Olivibacter domesticus]|uniref:mannose-1-phosphate guanylyltransferase n=1 Tax=Olivibacter domesticus TaxID=407022 RepID=A0A1H7ZUE5_OLID1|nr:mannose-1-phosphate guanylyltransferase [Olivibacter domesticus]SEM62252.1 mannose-1-phosphate guanylyltransferase [Olivibacter domesticus]